MKKLYATLLFALAFICSAWAQQDTIKVATADELYNALTKHGTNKNAVIKLTDDIDVSKYGGDKHLSMEFAATLDGYYTFVDDSLGVDPKPHSHQIKHLNEGYLFSKINGGTVKGIAFVECNTSDWWSFNSGVLCKEARGAEISDVLVIGCEYKANTWDGWSGTSGILASELDSCMLTNISILACNLWYDGSTVGCIAGKASGTNFKRCFTDPFTSIYSDSEPNAYVAGLVGATEKCRFDSCFNYGLVASNAMSDNLGGLTAESTECTFVDCANHGTVSQLSSLAYQTYRSQANDYRIFSMYLYASTGTAFGVLDYFTNAFKMMHNVGRIEASKTYDWMKDVSKVSKNRSYMSELRPVAKVMLAIAIIQTIYDIAMFIYEKNAPDEVGGITSVSHGCSYNRCFNDGFIVCRDAYCGGIVGYAATNYQKLTVIKDCINAGHIQGGEQTGGIVGYIRDGKVTNCLNVGTIDCIESTRGPIYGEINSFTTISNCFAKVHGAQYKAGATDGKSAIIEFGERDIFSGRAAYEMNRIMGNKLFRQNVGTDYYPSFAGNVVKSSDIKDDIDLIYTAEDATDFIVGLSDQYAHIVLKGDIDMKNSFVSFYRNSCKFHGTIDGQGHKIKNLKVEIPNSEKKDPEDMRNAMIGYADGAAFYNLTLDSCSLIAPARISGLVGHSENCVYENVHIKNSTMNAGAHLGGLFVVDSYNDAFNNCTTDAQSKMITDNFNGSFNNTKARIGGFAGTANGSIFVDCVNNAEVCARFSEVGGFVAQSENATFRRCTNNGYIHHNSSFINDNDELGGIAAIAKNSQFYECVNNGQLICDDENGGGIVGIGEGVIIDNCLNAATNIYFTENTNGGIIGNATKCTVTNCVSLLDYPLIGKNSDMNASSGNNYRREKSNHTTSNYEMGVDNTMMSSGIVARWLNNGYENRMAGKAPWHQIVMDDTYPIPFDYFDVVNTTNIKHYNIAKASDLVDYAKKVNGGDIFACAVLTNDIDLTGIDWTPIGNDQNRFRGIFDGQGHTIHGLKVNINSNAVGAGLFGVAHTGAEIRNVYLADDCEINNSGEAGAAAILGRVNIGWHWGNVVIENCGTYADVKAKTLVGGILGRVTTNSDQSKNVKVMIDKCFNMGTVTTSSERAGAHIVGYGKDNLYLTNTWSAGELKMNSGSGWPYDDHNPAGDNEFFAAYDSKIYVANCYVVDQPYGPRTNQGGVEKLTNNADTNGQLTYLLNGKATEPEDVVWYQKLGEDDRPMLTSRGGDIVYAYWNNYGEGYTNDGEMSSFDFYGPLRVMRDQTQAFLDGKSTKDLTLRKEIWVGNVELDRSVKANVPTTVVLPFSANASSSLVKFFSFDEMRKDGEMQYTAIMKEVEDGQIEAYTPYLVMYSIDAEGMIFGEATLEPVRKAETKRGEWSFIGATDYRVITLDDMVNDRGHYYGYAGMEVDGTKLGEFVRLGEGASIPPFRAYLFHNNLEEVVDNIDITTKAPTRAMADGGGSSEESEEDDEDILTPSEKTVLPDEITVLLKGANGETGIATFDNQTGTFTFDGWYDLNGNRVEEDYQGIRVKGDKKVIVK